MPLLVAKINGQLMTLTNQYPRETLLEMRRKNEFLCPQCHESLVLRVGRIKIPHFSHKADSMCTSLFAEGESQTHLLGKLQLFEHLSKLSGTTTLEAYIPELMQRPDVLFEDNGLKYAIEFQCSTIDTERFTARTNGYNRAGIIPVWILNTPFKQSFLKNSIVKITINAFQKLFINRHRDNQYLVTYQPSEKTFLYFSNLQFIQNNTYLAYVQVLPLHQQKLPLYTPTNLPFAKFRQQMLAYFSHRENYLIRKIQHSKLGVRDPLLRSIYELRLNRLQLPLFLGVPTKNVHQILAATVIWQTALFYYAKLNTTVITQLTTAQLAHFLRWMEYEQNDEALMALFYYIEWLKGVGIHEIQGDISKDKIIEALFLHLVAK